jgi:hypothetical protein
MESQEEQWQLSDSEEEELIDNFDPYENDPTFDTSQELRDFLRSCDNAKARDSDEEDIDYKSYESVKKICSCGKCEDIWSGSFEHVCCQQTDRWKETVSETEASGCLVESEPFN